MLTLQLSIVLLLILLNGFFAMAEIALVSARPARLQPLAAQGNRGAEAALELKATRRGSSRRCRSASRSSRCCSGTFGEATLGDAFRQYLIEQGGFWRRLRALDQHGGRRDRHFVFLADPRRTRAEADRADPSRTDCRRPGPVHARDGAVRGAARMVLERLDRADPAAVAAAAASRRRSPTRRSASCCARGWRPGTSRRPRPRSSRWRCGSATAGSAR